MPTPEDKRLHARFALSVPVELEVSDCPAQPELRKRRFRCEPRDVSLCGLQLPTEALLPPGTALRLRVTIRENDRPLALKLLGDVVWSNTFPQIGPVAGVFLRDRPRRHMRRWMDFISREFRRLFAQSATGHAPGQA